MLLDNKNGKLFLPLVKKKINMNDDNIKEVFIEAIKKIQENSGNEFKLMKEDSIPRDMQPDFDSLREVETLVQFCRLMKEKYDIDLDINSNIFYSKKTGARNIRDVINNVIKKVKNE